MEKSNFDLIIVLFVFIAIAATFFSCENPQNPTEPQRHIVTWGDLDYWQDYQVGDMFAYVNEENDSMIFVVTEKFREYNGYPKPGDEDYDSTEVVETIDDKSIGIVCRSEHNFLNDTIEMRQWLVLLGEDLYEYYIQFYDETARTYRFLSGPRYTGYILRDCDNPTTVLPDTLCLRLPYKNEQGTYEGGGIVVRRKSAIWWVDWDGHRWELVDLMNK